MAYYDIKIVSTLKSSSLPSPWWVQHHFNGKLKTLKMYDVKVATVSKVL
jgi:hypothetical protein